METHGQLHVAAGQLVGAQGQPAVLRGHAIGWDNWWPQYHNADVVAWLRNDWCIDVVRPAMGIEPDDAYLLGDPAVSKARMTTVVDAAIANGVYVIIDWHAHDIHQAEAIAFFSEMAQTYGHLPNVIYELFNEPDDETWPEVKAYSEAVIAAIRQHDPDNVIIVGTPEWDQRIDMVVDDPIVTDPNVMYAVHFYAATHGSWLRSRVADALEAGIPVFISESGGSEADGQGANDYDDWGEWHAFMDQNQLSWINWAIADKAGETVSMLQPNAPATGGWMEADLTATGIHVRSVLRSYNCP